MAPQRNASGMWSNEVTHMLVLSGVWVDLATSAMPVMPEVGSSRYSRSTSRSLYATRREVSTDQIGVRVDPKLHRRPEALAQEEHRLDFLVGLKHAALDLDALEAPALDPLLGESDHRLWSEHFAPFVVAGLLVEQVGGPRHPLADRRLPADRRPAGRSPCPSGRDTPPPAPRRARALRRVTRSGSNCHGSMPMTCPRAASSAATIEPPPGASPSPSRPLSVFNWMMTRM